MSAELNDDIRIFDKVCTRCLPYDLTQPIWPDPALPSEYLREISAALPHIRTESGWNCRRSERLMKLIIKTRCSVHYAELDHKGPTLRNSMRTSLIGMKLFQTSNSCSSFRVHAILTIIIYSISQKSVHPSHLCKYFIISFHVTLKKWHFATM